MKSPTGHEAASGKGPSNLDDADHAKDVHVLVVEDDERQRQVVVKILRELLDIHGIAVHDVPDVTSARTACRAWGEDTLALLLLDWRLPDGTAQDVLDAALATDADLHVSVMTTESAKAPAHDRWTVYAKPFRLHELRSLLSDIVHAWWAHCGQALQERASTRGVQFEVEVSDVKVHHDMDRFARLLYDFLSNAIGAAPAQGSIRLELEHPQGRAQVRVRHTGRGLSAERMRRMFQHFSHTEPSREAEEPSPDFGLRITQAIVLAQGGHIWVKGDGQARRMGFSLPTPPE